MNPGQPGELDIFFTAADFESDIEIDVDLPDQETDVQMLPVPAEVQNDLLPLDDAEDMDMVIDELPQVSEDEEPAASARSSRFVDISDADLEVFIGGQKNANTTRKTESHVKLFTSFMASKAEHRDMHLIPADTLDSLMSIFFVSVRKEVIKDADDEYEPSTIKAMQSSIERHLKEKRYPDSIIYLEKFFHTREAIRSKCRQLKKAGKGNRPQRKRAPSQQEVDQMWESGALGCDSPKSLLHPMWWVVNTRFGKRVNTENVSMRWGDIKPCVSTTGQKYLTYNERETKTRQGDDVSDVKDSIRVFQDPDGGKYCPVSIYETYARKRPQDACNPTSRFYL